MRVFDHIFDGHYCVVDRPLCFVHYALDRAVFRLSDPETRQAARGLLQ